MGFLCFQAVWRAKMKFTIHSGYILMHSSLLNAENGLWNFQIFDFRNVWFSTNKPKIGIQILSICVSDSKQSLFDAFVDFPEAWSIQIIDRICFRSKTKVMRFMFFSWDNNCRRKNSSMIWARRALLGIKTHPMGPVGVPRYLVCSPEPQKKFKKIQNQKKGIGKH